MGELARFFVILGHFEKALGVAYVGAMPGLGRRSKPADIYVFETCATSLRRFTGFDARGAEHDDGVGNAFLF